MDADVSPIFEESEALATPPELPPPLPVEQTDPAPLSCSRLDDIMEQHPPPLQQEYSVYNQPPPWHYGQVPQVPLPQEPKWDPFSTIGATAWVVLGVAFIIGFIIGKLR
jgi:hypothetical protein|tara:strand:- start:540 stop:866 length:327 start_codon:yes stop_codon:yes gene_type:complete